MTPPPMMIERAMTPPLSLIVESKFSVFDVGVRRLRFSSHCAIFPFMPVAVPAGGGAGRRRGPREAAARAMGGAVQAPLAAQALAVVRMMLAVPACARHRAAPSCRWCGRRAGRGRAGAAHGVLGADEQGGRAFLPPRFPAAWKEPPGTLRKPFAAQDSSAPACGRAMGPVACGMRFAACGMKHAAFGLRPVASGIRYVACGAGVDKDWRRWAVDTLLAAIDGG